MTLSDGAKADYTPKDLDLRIVSTALAGWKKYTNPQYIGLENIPTEGPVLLVGNHTTLGVLDLPLMVLEIHRSRRRMVRGLAENAHYAIPGYRDLLQRLGVVRGTRDNCRALFAAGEAVLVFPGGGREVSKRKGEKYQLLWKERLGFARMAIEAGCPVVPFAAIGAEDSYDIVIDADHPLLSPVRSAVERLGGRWELAPPLVRGIGPTPLPRRESYSFSFGTPIDTTHWSGHQDIDAAARELRDEVKTSVESQISSLLAARDAGVKS